MPKYLAQNFLAEALHHRQSLLDRMLVAPPHHIEFVDTYVHKGEVEDALYSTPWLLEEFQGDIASGAWSGQDDPHDQAQLEKAVKSDLERVAGGAIDVRIDVPESFGDLQSSAASVTSDDGIGSDVDLLLSQDIDVAIERATARGGELEECTKEEFLNENVQSWDLGIGAGSVEHLLESPESPCHHDILLTLLPRVTDLSRRLKPKLIQDPLVDDSGQMYTHMGVFSSDFQFDGDATEDYYTDVSTTTFPYEHFEQESIVRSEDGELDLVLELPISSPENLLSEEAVPVLPAIPSPHKDVLEEGKLQEQSSEELKRLVLEAKASLPQVVKLPDFSPSARLKLGAVDFAKLNDADMSHDSEDSGIVVGHALLESPCLPLTTSSPISTPLTKRLSALEPFPLSPGLDDKLVLMSPASERKFMKLLWEKDKMFDSILALTVLYPDIEETLQSLLTKTCVPVEAMLQLDLKPIKVDGDTELELPWDPLADSYREMSLAQKTMSCSTMVRKEEWCLEWREAFKSDVDVQVAAEGDDPRIHMDPDKTHVTQQTDIPSLKSVYPNTNPLDHRHQPLQNKFLSQFNKNQSSRTRGLFPKMDSNFSSLEAFMMLRSVTALPGVKRKADRNSEDSEEPEMKKTASNPPQHGRIVESSETSEMAQGVTSPTFQIVTLSDDYQSALSKIEDHAIPLVQSLKPFGLNAPHGFQELPVDRMKFFLKQQQKAFEDSQGTDKAGALLESCQLAACLYILGSLGDALMNFSLSTGLGIFSSLCQRYDDIIGGRLDSMKKELLQLQVAARERNIIPPKLNELVRVVSRWISGSRKSRSEKAVVLIEREFPSISGEILDFLQTIPNLTSCVFSFACDGTLNPLYLEAVEERLYHYDCLVVPTSSIAVNFPWEKVSLLVEYEEVKSSPFSGGSPPQNARLKQYVVLRTEREISASALADSGNGSHGQDLSSVQYTFLASENVISNIQLLKILEGRYNIMLIERDYSEIKKGAIKPKSMSYADLILDQSNGILVRPLSLLSTDVGLKTLMNTANALSLQYEKCWVILFAQAELSLSILERQMKKLERLGQGIYPFGGSVPINLARLHASVAHYCPKQHQYEVKVLCATSIEEAARLSRRIAEETHKTTKVWDHRKWSDGDWIVDEMSQQEKFLLTFPCLNSFSAQQMLRTCSLAELLVMDEQQLSVSFPWLPEKARTLFHKICNVNCGKGIPRAPPTVHQGLPLSHTTEHQTSDENSNLFQRVIGHGFESNNYETPNERLQNDHMVVLSSGEESEAYDPGYEPSNPSNLYGSTNPVYKHDNRVYGSNNQAFESSNPAFEPVFESGDPVFESGNLFESGDPVFESGDPVFESGNPVFESSHLRYESSRPSTHLVNDPASESPRQCLRGNTNEFYSGHMDHWQPQDYLSCGTNKTRLHHDLRSHTGPSNVFGETNTTHGTGPFSFQHQAHDLVNPSHRNPAAPFALENTSFNRQSVNVSDSTPQFHSSFGDSSMFNSFSTGRFSRALSQKQIKDSVLNSAPQPPHQLAREYYGNGLVSTRFMAGSTARRTPSSRNPVKSLDLGFDGSLEGPPKKQFHADDRSIAGTTTTSRFPTEPLSRSSHKAPPVTTRISRLPDLKAFHSKEHQQMTRHAHPQELRMPTSTWSGVSSVVGNATRQKRQHPDSQVPSNTMSPNGAEASFYMYGSPSASTGSVKLSPRKRKLVYEKVAGNGQTRLLFQ